MPHTKPVRFSFSAPILLLLFIGVSSNAFGAFKPPYNANFPKAQYPYSQAPDGCSGIKNPREVRDTWGPVDFTPTCDAHDACYYTLGSDWQNCNEAFRTGLLNACKDGLRVWVPGVQRRSFDLSTGKFKWVTVTPGFWSPPEPNTFALCAKVATAYYVAVQAGVMLNIFKDAQKKQRDYEKWIDTLTQNSRKYALSCIYNETPFNVNYSYKWGNGSWKSARLRPNENLGHWHRYSTPTTRKSPNFLVKFDRDFDGNKDDFKTYKMRKYAVKTTQCGRISQRDSFKRIRSSSRFVDLYHNTTRGASYAYYASADDQSDSLGMEKEPSDPLPMFYNNYLLIPGACASESSRFASVFGGCLDRASPTFAIFSAPSYQLYNHADAMQYCDDLIEGGEDDWQLPGDLTLQQVSGLPFENHIRQPNAQDPAPSDGKWSFWSSSVPSNTERASVVLKCPDGQKDEDTGQCSTQSDSTLASKRLYVVCTRNNPAAAAP